MDLPNSKNAPTDPAERAAFHRALDLAHVFAEAAWALSATLPSDIEDAATDDPEVASLAYTGQRSAALLEIEEAWRLLTKCATVERVVETAIIEAVRRCHPDSNAGATLADLKRLYPEAEAINPGTFKVAIEAWRDASYRHVRAGEEEGSLQGSHWAAVARVIAEALPRLPSSHSGEDPADRDERFAAAVERRYRRLRTGK
jgi:hypothetical protein